MGVGESERTGGSNIVEFLGWHAGNNTFDGRESDHHWQKSRGQKKLRGDVFVLVEPSPAVLPVCMSCGMGVSSWCCIPILSPPPPSPLTRSDPELPASPIPPTYPYHHHLPPLTPPDLFQPVDFAVFLILFESAVVVTVNRSRYITVAAAVIDGKMEGGDGVEGSGDG